MAAALFLADFATQAIVQDLRFLKQKPLEGTALEYLLRLADIKPTPPPIRSSEVERFSTLEADPSQERAVLRARTVPGLVLQGPPGTGKSQTIVNVVADCLGRGETVLVVCEKQAALEVVHKRLAAEGLDHRVFSIENTVSDRAKVLKALQAQVPEVLQRGPRQSMASHGKRRELAAQIDQTEADLDAYHEAVYKTHPRLGYSYRDVLARINADAAPANELNAPHLRSVLGPLDPGRLKTVIGECAGLLDTWIDGNVDASPLAMFAPFPVDAGLSARIAQDWDRWRNRETEHAEAIAAYRAADTGGEALVVSDPKPMTEWLQMHGSASLAVAPHLFALATKWQPLFSARGAYRGVGVEQRAALGTLLDRLRSLSPTSLTAIFGAHLKKFDNSALERLAQTARYFRPFPSFLAKLNPLRLAVRRATRAELRKLGLAHDDESCAAFAEAARLERETRKTACDLRDVLRVLGFSKNFDNADLAMLINAAEMLARDLARFAEFADRLDACPLIAAAWNAAIGTGQQAREKSPLTAFARFLRTLTLAKSVAEARVAALTAFTSLEPHLTPDTAADCRRDITADAPGRLPLADIAAALPSLVAYQTFRLRIRTLSAEAQSVFLGLGDCSLPLRSLDPSARREAMAGLLRCEAARHWQREIETASPELLQRREQLDERVKRLAALDERMRDANRKVLGDVDAALLSDEQAWSRIWALKGTNSKRLRQVADLGRNLGLFKLRPVWLVNPDVVSRMFPLDPGLFDVVVFDEASQMRVANAVPALFRARRCVVSGDDKQLPPTNFFGSRLESDEDDADDDDWIDTADTGDAEAERAEQQRRQTNENRRHIKECEDLLALSRGLLPQANLDIHYRSTYRELIAFSNAAFYGGRLNIPVRRPLTDVARFKPIEVRRIDGTYRGQTNPEEAVAVVDFLSSLWRERTAPPTVGVVTFNMKQADLINDEIAKRADADRAFGRAHERESSRKDRDEDVGFFVKNLENVQGDERDWIVFSTTFGHDEAGVFKRTFGALGQQGGERRLNVAATRAKEKVLLFTSMPTAKVSTLFEERREPTLTRDYLQVYLRYCELTDAGEFEAASAALNAFPRAEPRGEPGDFCEADALVGDALGLLQANGFNASLMPADDAFAVDIAVTHGTTGLYTLGVEFDATAPSVARKRPRS